MDFNRNPKAFLKALPLKKMSGHQKFLALAALECAGENGHEIRISEIKSKWRKSLLITTYNPALYDRAQKEGWVDPIGQGRFSVTKSGLEHLSALAAPDGVSEGELKRSGSLIVVNRKAAHSFDKFLRKAFAEAKSEVLIADSYVDGRIFDTVLDVIPKTVTVKLVYFHKSGNFGQRSSRFSKEYGKFQSKRYKHLHDRFLMVDDVGYLLGPSIKDAASNAPALVCILASKESRFLRTFFDEIWSKAKSNL